MWNVEGAIWNRSGIPELELVISDKFFEKIRWSEVEEGSQFLQF